ncbi:MAG: hypothetical protein KDE47_13505 [Caldilineaceae bacterium]|nr:hypothetical protein [Caldilineaceae bacterium]
MFDEFDEDQDVDQSGQEIDGFSKGWRLERMGNYWRWRWQKKDALGNPVTFLNDKGKKRYKRGSKYVGKEKPTR